MSIVGVVCHSYLKCQHYEIQFSSMFMQFTASSSIFELYKKKTLTYLPYGCTGKGSDWNSGGSELPYLFNYSSILNYF